LLDQRFMRRRYDGVLAFAGESKPDAINARFNA